MRAYILCGGFGTRLSAVLQGGQKAVVEVHGRPFLALVLAQLRKAGVEEAVLCAHYRADQLAQLLPGLEAEAGLALRLVVEAQPLGTGGAVLHALQEVPPVGRFLVLNADTYLDEQAYRLAYASPHNAMLAVQVEDRSRYGSLDCSASGQVLALNEKGLEGPGRVNGGVYGFNAAALSAFPVASCSMEKDLLPQLIAAASVVACDYSGPFIDIGTPESLQAFKTELGGAQP